MLATFEQVSACLERAGIESVSLASGSEGAVMAMPTYGRVIGLWSDRALENHFWVNATFLEHVWTDDDGKTPTWANPGGDRVWLSPEREFFIRDLARPWETYSVPACMDPGDYSYELSEQALAMANSGVAEAFASTSRVCFKISRCIRPLAGDVIGDLARGVCLKGAGYKEETVLEVDARCPLRVGFWNLIQVPLGGNAFAPVKHPGCHTAFFGQAGKAVCYGDDCLKVGFTRQEMFKIGLKASSVSGRVGYMRECEDGTSLLLRGFETGADADYADTPWDTPGDAGYALQVFCGGREHPFGELEYHSPAIGAASGLCRYVGRSVVYAFSGPRERCEELSRFFVGDPRPAWAED